MDFNRFVKLTKILKASEFLLKMNAELLGIVGG
jgi:hypothetical protein